MEYIRFDLGKIVVVLFEEFCYWYVVYLFVFSKGFVFLIVVDDFFLCIMFLVY